MKKVIKYLSVILMTLIVVSVGLNASAQGLPYDTYFYVDGKVKASPATLSPKAVISGTDMSCGALNSPQDIYIANDMIYIADTGNNRILVLDYNYNCVKIISQVTDNGAVGVLSGPTGVFADEKYLYIADTGNARVLILDGSNNVVSKLEKPDDALYDQSRAFQPQKILRDKNGYYYVLSLGTYEGALLYNPDGTFNSFFGANRVTVTVKLLVENAWRKILNKTQLSKIAKNIPQEYSSFDMDANGFIYTCSANSTDKTDQLKKLNSTGSNVWATGTNYGDTVSEWSGSTPVVSRFADIAVDDAGFVFAVDNQRGHIFQYSDTDGRILSVSSNAGLQEGTFDHISAIECYGENVYVLDGNKCNLTVFEPTEYGNLIRKSLNLYNDGQYDASYEMWEDVIKCNGNMQLAYSGIGKSLLGKGEYTEAMRYFKLANDTSGYSSAFTAQRKFLLRKNFVWILPAVAILIAAFLITGVIERKRKVDHSIKKYHPWQYPLYIMMHPSNGFNDLRWTKRGSVITASVIIVLWLFSDVVKKQLSAFLFNPNYSSKVSMNVFTQILAMAVLFLLFVIINWAVCTLFEGKGTAENVYIYTAYSILPLLFGNFLYAGLSYAFSLNEAAFLQMFYGIFVCWSVLLLLRGLGILHEYSIKKVILSLISTAFGIAIVIFLALLLVSLFNKVGSFVSSVINELIMHSQK